MKKIKCDVYWNLHKKKYSVLYKQKVIAHSTRLWGEDVKAVTRKKTKAAAIKKGVRNVHLLLRGEFVVDFLYEDLPQKIFSLSDRITYYYKKDKGFILDGEVVSDFQYLHLTILGEKPNMQLAVPHDVNCRCERCYIDVEF